MTLGIRVLVKKLFKFVSEGKGVRKSPNLNFRTYVTPPMGPILEA